MSKRVSSPAFEYIQRERERERERERDVKKKTREIERDKKQTLARGGDAVHECAAEIYRDIPRYAEIYAMRRPDRDADPDPGPDIHMYGA